MSDWYDEDDFEERDEEAVELPEVRLDEPAPCCVCGKVGCINACFRCGKPVCYAQVYTEDSSCGGWILDWWTSGSTDPDDGNEFYCRLCLEEINSPFDQEQALREYTILMEAGPLAENEQALRLLVNRASRAGLYFDYDRGVGKYCLVS